jgi:hypothetical protein
MTTKKFLLGNNEDYYILSYFKTPSNGVNFLLKNGVIHREVPPTPKLDTLGSQRE